MKRIIPFLLFAILSINISAENLSQKELNQILNEADDLIDDLEEGTQDRIGDAMLHQLRGQGMELQKLRESGINLKSVVSGVEEIDVRGTGEARGINMKLYRKRGLGGKETKLMIFFHGGGWALGSPEEYSYFCSSLAASGDVTVLVPYYSLTPEHSYYDALDDCISVIKYAVGMPKELGKFDGQINVGGDGAGGNLALSSVIYLVKDGKMKSKIKSLSLYYPIVSKDASATASWKKYGRGYGLDSRLMDIFTETRKYANEKRPGTPVSDVSDYPAEEGFEALRLLPPTMIIYGGRDLMFETIADFSSRLGKSGVKTQETRLPGALHGFVYGKSQPTALATSVRLTLSFLNLNPKN